MTTTTNKPQPVDLEHDELDIPENLDRRKGRVEQEEPAVITELEPVSIAKPTGFSLDKFKSTCSAVNVDTLPTSYPIHRGAEAKDFFRLHPDEAAYWAGELCFVSVPVQGARSILHLITENLAREYLKPADIIRCRLALAAKPYNVFFFCIVPSRNLDNKWNEDALRGCRAAMTQWTKLTSRRHEGVDGYDITCARSENAFVAPKWPKQSLSELIEVTFAGHSIESADHPGLLRLLGAEQSLK